MKASYPQDVGKARNKTGGGKFSAAGSVEWIIT
jgi:hypothetical protein